MATGEASHAATTNGANDGIIPNPPSGRLALDRVTKERRQKRASLSRKKKNIMHIGKWNVRTMSLGKLDLLIKELDNINMDLTGLCETRWDGEGHFQHGKHTIIYCGSSTAMNGVAFIVSGKLKNSIISYRAVSDRIISVKINTKTVPTTFCADICPELYALRGRNRRLLRSTPKSTRTNSSSRKVPVLAHFTIHMVEIIQLYTDQPHTWLGFRHHPSSSVFQPYVWLDTISNSLNF